MMITPLTARFEDATLESYPLRTEDGFEFPVPATDVGSATMLATDKALLFMRYIRKHVDLVTQARADDRVAA